MTHPPQESNDKECVECKQPIENYAGNPSFWGTYIADMVNKGKMAHYHVGCLTLKLDKLQKALETLTAERDVEVRRAREAESEVDRLRNSVYPVAGESIKINQQNEILQTENEKLKEALKEAVEACRLANKLFYLMPFDRGSTSDQRQFEKLKRLLKAIRERNS